MRRRWPLVAVLVVVVVALVFIGARGHDQFLYRQCVAIQHGVPPSLTGSAQPLLSPGHHVVFVGGSNISGYAAVGTQPQTLVHCERGWP